MADDARAKDPLPVTTVGDWSEVHQPPPNEPAFYISGKYVIPSEGDEQMTSKLVPLIYDIVRSDLVRLSDVPVSSSAIEKIGDVYRGVIDSKGKPFLFSMSGEGIFTRQVRPEKEQSAWGAYHRLLDREFARSLEEARQRS